MDEQGKDYRKDGHCTAVYHGECKHSIMDVVVDLFDCRGREDE